MSESEIPRMTVVANDHYEWIDIVRPGTVATEHLQTTYAFHQLDLEDVLSRRQRPKVDIYPDYLFAVLHIPYRDHEGIVRGAELDLFIMADLLVTLPGDGIAPELLAIEELPETTPELLYQLLRALFKSTWSIIDWMAEELEVLEGAIFAGEGESMLHRMNALKQSIIACSRIIKPERAVLRQLERQLSKWDERMSEYYDDLIDAVERIWDLLEHYTASVAALDQANENVIAHRMNKNILFLTVINIILLPLTLLASIYGMNVPMPGQESANTAWFIIAGMILAATVINYLVKRVLK